MPDLKVNRALALEVWTQVDQGTPPKAMRLSTKISTRTIGRLCRAKRTFENEGALGTLTEGSRWSLESIRQMKQWFGEYLAQSGKVGESLPYPHPGHSDEESVGKSFTDSPRKRFAGMRESTSKEAGGHFHVSPRTILLWLAQKKVKGYKTPGGRRVIVIEDQGQTNNSSPLARETWKQNHMKDFIEATREYSYYLLHRVMYEELTSLKYKEPFGDFNYHGKIINCTFENNDQLSALRERLNQALADQDRGVACVLANEIVGKLRDETTKCPG